MILWCCVYAQIWGKI